MRSASDWEVFLHFEQMKESGVVFSVVSCGGERCRRNVKMLLQWPLHTPRTFVGLSSMSECSEKPVCSEPPALQLGYLP